MVGGHPGPKKTWNDDAGKEQTERHAASELQDRRSLLYLSIAISRDRKSTRLNSSHRTISYAVFCLKKKKTSKQKPNPELAKKKAQTNLPNTPQPSTN